MLVALEGVRVLEVGSNLAAHFVGRQLAELGAEVLKVEPPGGDPSRRRGPFVRDVPHQDGSATFLYLNVGKRGVTLNQSTPTGREILGNLAAGSDIVLWGDDIERGRAAAEGVQPGRTAVWLLVSPYGASGPKAGWHARTLTIFHAGGEGYLLPGGTSWETYQDRPPIKGAEHLGEYSAGQSMTAAAIIGWMLGDPSTGPVLIDASIQEALALEESPAPAGAAADPGRGAGPDSPLCAGESALGRGAHPGRAADARFRRECGDGPPLPAAGHAAAAFAALADRPPQPARRYLGGGLLPRTDAHGRDGVRLLHHRACAVPHRVRQRHGPSHGGLDLAAADRGHGLEPSPALSDPRPRPRLRARLRGPGAAAWD